MQGRVDEGRTRRLRLIELSGPSKGWKSMSGEGSERRLDGQET